MLDLEEGKRIAHALGDSKAVILRNHGLLTVGHSVDEAAWWFITMERSCQAQLLAEAAGNPVLIEPEMAEAHRADRSARTSPAGSASSRCTSRSPASSPTCSTDSNMRQVLALAAAATLMVALADACGGGSADTEEVGARQAACKNAPDFALRSPSPSPGPDLVAFRPSALPPEPVEDLLPKAKYVFEANVTQVLYQGDKPERSGRKNVAGRIPPERCQVVQLDVTRMIAGADRARRSPSSNRSLRTC